MPLDQPREVKLGGADKLNRHTLLRSIYWLAAGLLFFLSAVSYRSSNQLAESMKWVDHTHQVIENLQRINLLYGSTTASLRIFILHSRPEFLQEYKGNRDLMPKEVASVRGLTIDNPRQQRRFDALEPLLDNRVVVMESIVTLAQAGHREEATRLLLSEGNIRLRRRFNGAIAAMEKEEYVLLGQRRLSSAQMSNHLRHMVLMGTLSSLFIMLAIKAWLHRETHLREQIEEEVHRQRAMFQSVLESMGDGVSVADENGKFVIWNPTAERLMGPAVSDLPVEEWSKHYRLFLPDQKTPYPLEDFPMIRAIHGENTSNVEIFVRHPKHPEGVWISVTGRPLRDAQGGAHGGVIVFQDVTAQKEIENNLRSARDMALESARFKSEFMANMSHEIRTPMNAILGMTELLAETDLAPIQKEYVEIFRRSGEHLLTVINDILDFSKVESALFKLATMDFNLADLMEHTLNLLTLPAQEKGLKLAYHIAPEVPFFLSGDPDHLRQIITNVVGNAIKFTEQGEVQLRIKNEDPREKGLPCRLQFSVTDTGIGIAPDKLSAIFESFVQADSSITRKYGGTGLGLTISKKLVELMGGSMYVTSDLGKGTCFFFSIPFETPKEPPSMMAAPYRPPVIALPLVKSVNRPLRILLVEDSSDNQRLILAYLKKSRHAVDVADNGAIAVKKTAEGSYDLVFMDMQMPVMDGYTATRAIRTWESRDGQTRKATPIIALTAYALKEEIEKSYRAGCTNHLTKPIKKAVLMEMIGRYSMEASLVT